MANILHIATIDSWKTGKASGFYAIDTLKSEGFIHCSTPKQVVRVARERFAGRDDLVLLEIAENRVRVEIKYENCEGGTELFPHLYGPLNVDAVVCEHEFAPDENGEFKLPVGLDGG
ncbi:MAG: hypothetical protein DHS20C16_28400 [Phycisphaerae bacterium]|nr:MAG: hypothetical protein DHS20C16_28400 [Phycisphaerae bacterium]